MGGNEVYWRSGDRDQATVCFLYHTEGLGIFPVDTEKHFVVVLIKNSDTHKMRDQ